jgi:hypothetical protein
LVLEAEFQEKGTAEKAPRGVPSTMRSQNQKPVQDWVPFMETVPETVAPFEGEEIVTQAEAFGLGSAPTPSLVQPEPFHEYQTFWPSCKYSV